MRRLALASPLLITAVLVEVALEGAVRAQNPPKALDGDPWQAVRFLVGRWEGPASGEPGSGKSSRTYEFVLADRFIYERNTSTYLARKEGDAGEVTNTGASSATTKRASFFGYGSFTRRVSRCPTS